MSPQAPAWPIEEANVGNEIRDRAQRFYAAYTRNSGNLNYQGEQCPAWADLPVAVRSHWCAVATSHWAQPSQSADVDAAVAAKNVAYTERNRCVAALAMMACMLGWKAGLGAHDQNDRTWDHDWRTIIFIETPTGQVSWHLHDSEVHLFAGLPQHGVPWDGHTTTEKYERLDRLRLISG